MAFGTHQHLSGVLRGLLIRPHELTQTIDVLWQQMPTPRENYANRIAENCRFKSKGKLVLRDLLRLMIKEHDAYLDAISIFLAKLFQDQDPDIGGESWARDPGYGMAHESHSLSAWHLAANRAEARLLLMAVPEKLENGRVESWMQGNRNRQDHKVVSLSRYQAKKYFSILRAKS